MPSTHHVRHCNLSPTKPHYTHTTHHPTHPSYRLHATQNMHNHPCKTTPSHHYPPLLTTPNPFTLLTTITASFHHFHL